MGLRAQEIGIEMANALSQIKLNESQANKNEASLLGAYGAQMNLGLAAIGGKDSMSGTYQDINVPPTLINIRLS